jgi:hypothetical protein
MRVLEEIRGRIQTISQTLDLVDDDQEDACQDERIRQRWTVELSQHGPEMDMLP